MSSHSRYVITENIERFEHLLRGGGLDRQQSETVVSLLAQAREALAELENHDVPPFALLQSLSW